MYLHPSFFDGDTENQPLLLAHWMEGYLPLSLGCPLLTAASWELWKHMAVTEAVSQHHTFLRGPGNPARVFITSG